MPLTHSQLQWLEALRRIWECTPRMHYWQHKPGISLQTVKQFTELAAKARAFMGRRDERLRLYAQQYFPEYLTRKDFDAAVRKVLK